MSTTESYSTTKQKLQTMSLAFQNAESVKQALFEELQNLLSSESNVRQSAEQRMKQLEFTEGMQHF